MEYESEWTNTIDPNETESSITKKIKDNELKNIIEQHLPIDLGPMFDDREPPKFFDKLNELKLPYQKVKLEIGDGALSFDHVLEIKRIDKEKKAVLDSQGNLQYDDEGNVIKKHNNDVRASLFDKRYQEQSKNRFEKYKWNALIVIVQDGAECFDDHFTAQHWISMQKTLSICFNTHIYTVSSEEEAIMIIYEFYRQIQKGEYFVPPVNKQPRPKTLFEQQIYFLSGLIGMGYKKCKQLLDYFGNIRRILDWIRDMPIRYTKSGTPKIAKTDLVQIKGYGAKFFIKNKQLLEEVGFPESKENDKKEEI
jgi:ERCC4-type nuclease